LGCFSKRFGQATRNNRQLQFCVSPQCMTGFGMLILMEKTYIDKLAFIDLENQKVLSTLSNGKDVWYIPGGKRDGDETDQQALMREIKEELSVDLVPETIRQYGIFEAQAHGKPGGTVVRMTCYTAKFTGTLNASAEVAEYRYVDYSWKAKSSPVDQLIFDDLYIKGLIK